MPQLYGADVERPALNQLALLNMMGGPGGMDSERGDSACAQIGCILGCARFAPRP
jgi:hypothetical protein